MQSGNEICQLEELRNLYSSAFSTYSFEKQAFGFWSLCVLFFVCSVFKFDVM